MYDFLGVSSHLEIGTGKKVRVHQVSLDLVKKRVLLYVELI